MNAQREPDGERASRGDRVGPEALLLPVLLLALLWLEGAGGRGLPTGDLPTGAVDGPSEVVVLEGRLVGDEGPLLEVRLAPLSPDPSAQEFDARVLRARLGLGPGEPFRLEVTGPQAASVRFEGGSPEGGGPRVDWGGSSLAPVETEVPGLAGLFAPPVPGSGVIRALLWGPRGEGGALLACWLLGADGTRRAVEIALEPQRVSAARLPRSVDVVGGPHAEPAGELQAARARIEELEAQVLRLESELSVSEEARLLREQAFIEFQRSLARDADRASQIDRVRLLMGLAPLEREDDDPQGGDRGGAVDGSPEADGPSELELEVAAARLESEARALRLNALLRAEGVWSLELVEAGNLLMRRPVEAPGSDGLVPELPGVEPSDARTEQLLEAPRSVGTGPVVFRMLDDRGRLTGGMRADLLRLEGSRSGRSLSLVLERGAFLQGGLELPFAGGAHRIELRHVDPEPFMGALPELFAAEDLTRRVDDGRWVLDVVRAELNGLLTAEEHGRRYRLVWLGGVIGEIWRDVEFEVRDEQGRVERRIFADEMELDLSGETLVLRLFDGTTMRGGEKAPFLDGTMRIVVPRVDTAAWSAAALPGIVAEPVVGEG